MLYFITRHGTEQEWHVGDALPDPSVVNILKEVQADGHELEFLRSCSDLPHDGSSPSNPNPRVVRWFDFDAINAFVALRKKYVRHVPLIPKFENCDRTFN